MINELSMLYDALSQNGIQMDEWCQDYQPMKLANAKNFCIRLILGDGDSVRIEAITEEQSRAIRKYGNNQGSFPVMNLRPLYHISNNNDAEYILKSINEDINVSHIRDLCIANNWNDAKFRRKYTVCMSCADKLYEMTVREGNDCEQKVLTDYFRCIHQYEQPNILHNAICEAAFNLLYDCTDVEIALNVLFDVKHSEMVVIIDHEALIQYGMPVVSRKFTQRINRILLDCNKGNTVISDIVIDAFGNAYDLSLDETNPMPSAALANGYNVKIRSMYGKQPCQYRYGVADDASYLISQEKRSQLKKAFEWIGSAENEGTKWIKVGKGERLFAYYSRDITLNPATIFAPCIGDGELLFDKRVNSFFWTFNQSANHADYSMERNIRTFMIRKTDKARTKIVYAESVTPKEFQSRSKLWADGIKNVPQTCIGKTAAISPGDALSILNVTWKQNGNIIKDEHYVFKFYDGMSLFFGNKDLSKRCLRTLINRIERVAPTLSAISCNGKKLESYGLTKWWAQREIALIGVLLFQHSRKKEKYMEDFAFLCGRMLKISDEIHATYCKAKRNGKLPSMLVGGSMYKQAINRPAYAIALLGQKMMPYIAWAKSYDDGPQVGLVVWLLNQYSSITEQVATGLQNRGTVRLNDIEKAEMFLGYMSKIKGDSVNNNTDNSNNEENK